MLNDTVRKICVFQIFLATSTSLVGVSFAPYLESIGFDLATVGLLISMMAFSSLASRFPAGLIYNGRRAKWLACLSLLLLGVSTLAYLVAGANYPVLIILRICQGLGFGGASTMGMALLMDTLPPQGAVTRVMGWFMGSLSVGHASGNLLGGYVAEHLGYDASFVIATAFTLLAALSIGLIRGQVDPAASRPRAAESAQRPRSSGFVSKVAYLRQIDVLGAAVLAFTQGFLSQVLFAFFPLYGLSVGLNLTSVGFLSAVHSVSSAVSRPAAGEIIRLIKHSTASPLGILINGIFLFFMPSFSSVAALLVFNVALGASRGLVMVGNAVGINESTRGDPTKRGTASGVYNGAGDLGAILGPFIGGLLAAQVGLDAMMRITGLSLLVFYFAFLLFARAVQVRREVPA